MNLEIISLWSIWNPRTNIITSERTQPRERAGLLKYEEMYRRRISQEKLRNVQGDQRKIITVAHSRNQRKKYVVDSVFESVKIC